MRDKDTGPDRVKHEKQQGDVPPANLQQPGKGPTAQERQEDTGKTEAQDFFRQDKNPIPRQDETGRPQRQPRGDEEDASGKPG